MSERLGPPFRTSLETRTALDLRLALSALIMKLYCCGSQHEPRLPGGRVFALRQTRPRAGGVRVEGSKVGRKAEGSHLGTGVRSQFREPFSKSNPFPARNNFAGEISGMRNEPIKHTCRFSSDSLYFSQKFLDFDVCVAERSFQSIAIYFVMKRENDHSSVSVFHLYMTSFGVNSHKTQTLQGGQDLPPR